MRRQITWKQLGKSDSISVKALKGCSQFNKVTKCKGHFKVSITFKNRNNGNKKELLPFAIASKSVLEKAGFRALFLITSKIIINDMVIFSAVFRLRRGINIV